MELQIDPKMKKSKVNEATEVPKNQFDEIKKLEEFMHRQGSYNSDVGTY